MKTLRRLGAERRISVPHLAIFLAVALLLYTVVFCVWTRVSPWAVVRFLAAIVFILYFPGKLLVVAARLRSGLLEDWALSLVLGMAASTGLYFICALFGVRGLFPLWPLGATGFCLFRGARNWRRVVGCHFPLDMSRVLLAGLVGLILVPLFFLPMYYRNMVLLPDGSMSYLDGPADPFFHLSVANELTHSVDPQVPFLAGQPLPYHYAMHLLAAMLSDVARLSTLDLMFRFLPTFFLAVTALAIFCFARIWMGSSYAALLAVFLVIFGEDFSLIPGLLLRSDDVWSYQFFHVPNIYSFYFINPILPALAILFAGLLCLGRFYEKGGRGWLVVTAFLFSSLSAYKLFTGIHALTALAIAGVTYLLLFRDRVLLKIVAHTALGSAPFLLAGRLGGARLRIPVERLRQILGSYRRYSSSELRDKVEDAGFEITRLSYFNSLLFPFVWRVRRFKNFAGRWKAFASDLEMPTRGLNSLLASVFSLEGELMARCDLPLGVSLICIARKRPVQRGSDEI